MIALRREGIRTKESRDMEIHLPEDLRRFVPDQVRTGRFPSEDQVVHEALREFQKAQGPAIGQPKPDPWLGSMRQDAELLDEIVEEARKIREERTNGSGHTLGQTWQNAAALIGYYPGAEEAHTNPTRQ